MKNGYARAMLLACAVAGCITGFGINEVIKRQQKTEHAKDDTLLREEYDSVFFTEETTPAPVRPTPTVVPTASPVPVLAPVATTSPVATGTPAAERPTEPEELTGTPSPTELPKPVATNTPMPATSITAGITQAAEPTGIPTQMLKPTATASPVPTVTTAPPAEYTITYPAQIFGQTPVENRTDGYVSYFEFALDLVTAMEGEIRERNLNETVLFSKFMLKALFCGIDIRGLKINDPIPRRQAALAIHLAAEILDRPGVGTTAAQADRFAKDVKGCTTSERKAIAYLYEQGFLENRTPSGQKFSPDLALTEIDCATWIKKCKKK